MAKPYMLITPEPQLKLETQLGDYNFGHGLSIRPLDSKTRRRLLDIAKEKQCSDDCLRLLLESELIFCAQIPSRSTKADGSLLVSFIYRPIAEEILKRIFRCMLLFQWVPAPLFLYCWFHVSGTPDDMDLDTLKMLDAEWEYIDQFTNIDWRSGQNEAEDITPGMKALQRYWDKFSLLCQIDQLNDILIDTNIEKKCLQYAHEHVVGKIEELMKARFGPDTVISESENETNVKSGDNATDLPILPTASDEMQRAWHLVGLSRAYSNELNKLSQELNVHVLDKRLDRAFQFFTEAFRILQPHQFIAFCTCLESLFCTSTTEIAFQIASRIAWFLSRYEYEKRAELFAMAKRLYDLRSKIVHGVKYNYTEIDDSAGQLTAMLRIAFEKIIADDYTFRIFRDEHQKISSKRYLEDLNLGKPIDACGTD